MPASARLLASLAGFLLFGAGACSWFPKESLISDERLNGAATLQAFSPLRSTLLTYGLAVVDRRDRQLGLVTRHGGEFLCKASDVLQQGPLHVQDARGRKFPVILAGVDEVSDVGLLRPRVTVEGTRDRPLSRETPLPAEGSWVSCLGDLRAVKVGIVSGRARTISKPRAMLGIILKAVDDRPGAVIEQVLKRGAADQADLKPEDRIVAMNAESIRDYQHLQRLVRALRPGTRVLVDFERGGKKRRKALALGDETMTEGEDRNLKMSGPVSPRRAGFEEVFQHDCPVGPESMGGPVVDLEGRVVGMNIARSDRVTTYALTPRAVRRALERLRQHLPQGDNGA